MTVYLKTTAFAIILFAGCGRHDESSPPNRDSDSTGSAVSAAGNSDSPSKSGGHLNKGISDDGEIRIAACEYILTHEFIHLTDRPVFILIGSNEMQVLASKLPGFQLRSGEQIVSRKDRLHENETEYKKFVIDFSEIARTQNEAVVKVTAGSFFSGKVGYPCHLKKRTEWIVERVGPVEAYDGSVPPQWHN